MALYIPAGRRRRRLIVTACAGLAVGLALGAVIGRMTAPSPAGAAADAKQQAKAVTGQLEAFPIHYEQASKGEIDRASFKPSLDAGLNRANEDLAAALAQAPWIDESTRGVLRANLSNVKNVADRDAPPAEFDGAVRRSVDSINTAFGGQPPQSAAPRAG